MKSAIITGGTKGIGLALVELFYKEGYKVVTCARSAADLQAMQAEMPGLHTMPADFGQMDQVRAFAGFARGHVGRPDVLVNNVGLFEPGQIENEPEGQLARILALNVESAYTFSRAFLPDMIAARNGHIINMCSIASIMAYTSGASYTISKFALLGFSKVLREEMKPHNVRVTQVLPGATLTDSWAGVDLPAERFIDAGELAKLIFAIVQAKPGTVVEELLVRPQLGDI